MITEYFKRTTLPEAFKASEKLTNVAELHSVKIDSVGNGDIRKIEIDADEKDIRKLNESIYEDGWVHDLDSLLRK